MNTVKKIEINEEKLDALIERINAEAEQASEYVESTDSPLAEYCSDLGYGEADYTEYELTDEAKVMLEMIPKKERKEAIVECSSVELHSMYTTTNEVFSVHIGEQEHEFSDELKEKLSQLTDEERAYVSRKSNVYIPEKYRDYYYTDHGCDRFILVLDEDRLKSWIKKNGYLETVKARKARIEKFLDEAAFRDYSFKKASEFGKYNKARSINLLNPSNQELENALHDFSRDGYSSIVIYLGALI